MMTKSKAAEVLIAGLDRWQVQTGEAFAKARQALQEENFAAAAEVLEGLTVGQGQVSLNFKSAMRKGGWLPNER